MLNLNQKNSFIYFLTHKYALKTGVVGVKNNEKENLYGFKNENKNIQGFSFDKLEKALSRLEKEKKIKNKKDIDDMAVLKWNRDFDKHYNEINKLVKDAHSIINSSQSSQRKKEIIFNLKEIEERNNKIVVSATVLTTGFVLSLFALVFLGGPTIRALNFFDSLALYPFNKLEEAYNFNYNEGVFRVAQIDRKIDKEVKSKYIRNLNLEKEKEFKNNILKLSKKSILSSSQKEDDSAKEIIVMGVDNSEEIEKMEENRFKKIFEDLAQKQIDLVDRINRKLLDLIN